MNMFFPVMFIQSYSFVFIAVYVISGVVALFLYLLCPFLLLGLQDVVRKITSKIWMNVEYTRDV